MKIIRYYLLIIVLTLCSVSRAQAQSYSIGDLTNHFYKLYFSVKNVDGIIYLYTKMRTEKMDFENPPKIKMRTFGDNIIELTGEKLTSQDDMVAVPMGVLIIPISEKNIFARFAITESEMKLINEGVKKIRLYTLRESYDKSFKKDNLGKKIYKQYQKVLSEGDDIF